INVTPEQRFTPAQAQLLESIARNVAVAIETLELYRGQQEEAQISAALARVGHEMISSLDLPVLLDRLCQLTTEVLGCESSHTVLWNREEDAYMAVAAYGYPPEPWDSLRLVRVPPENLTFSLQALQQDDVYQLRTSTLADPALQRLNQALGITVAMGMALRRGREMIGFHVACYRGRDESFSPLQERIARGIAQL